MGLVDDIAVSAGCPIVSDLRHHPECYPLHSLISAIPADAYEAGEWADAVRYFTDFEPQNKSAESYRQRLLQYAVTSAS